MKDFIRFSISLLLVSFNFLPAVGQVTNKGVQIGVLPNTGIYVMGDYLNDSLQLVLSGASSIFSLRGNLINNSSKNIVDESNPISTGTLIFNGFNQTISGSSSFIIPNVTLNGKVTLQHHLTVSSTLVMNSLLDLGSYSLNLLNSGDIVNELEANRIYSQGNGTINYTLAAQPTMADSLGHIGLRLAGSIFSVASIKRGHAVQPNAADGSISRYFDVNLNPGDEIQKIRFYYFDIEIPSSIPENNLQVYASFDGGTSWKKLGATKPDFAANFIEVSGLTITSNVRFTLANKDCMSPPVVNLGASTQNFCKGVSVTLDAENTGDFYTWSNSATTQTITTSTAGLYSVVVQDFKGCEGTAGVTLVERPIPTPDFTVGISCPNTPTNFTNASSIASGGMTYSWDFGDPATTLDNSTNTNATYIYQVSANYSVSLTATSDYNCVANLTKTVTIYPLPQVDFLVQNVCLGQSSNFTNNSTIASGGMIYLWDFGDATTSTQISPSKLYATPSSFSVTLTATSDANCISSLTKNVDIYYTPVANFSSGNVCENILVPFTNTSTIAGGSLSYQWDFGDATNSSSFAPAKLYPTYGTYSVTLTAISDYNCTNQITKSIDIYSKPIVNFLVADDCQDKGFNFSNNTTSAQGTLSYSWDFSDGTFSSSKSPTKSFSAAGLYNVLLTANTSLGCSNSLTKAVNVFPVPIADFAITNACQDDLFNFVNNSNVASGSLSFDWDFGDGSSSFADNPSKNYSASGSYQVSLIATSDKGCAANKKQTLQVYGMPVLDLGDSIVTCGISYTLNALNPGSSYLWSDGSTAQTLTVTTNGTFSVKVSTVNNCSITVPVNVKLNGIVTPDLGPDKTVCGIAQINAGYPGSTYEWSNGNSTQKIDVLTTGNYSVKVIDPNGCIGTDDVNITVNPVPQVDLGPDIVICADQKIVLDAQNPGSSYLWTDNSVKETFQATVSGYYGVTVTNQFNCTGSDYVKVTINPLPINILPPSLVACDKLILDAGNSGATYAWSTGEVTQRIAVTASGTYQVKITSAQNCSVTENSNIIINYSPPVFIGSDKVMCYGESIVLDAGNAGDSYRWSDNSNLQTLFVNKSGLYWVEVKKLNGCFGRDSINILINSKITNSLKPIYQICASGPRVLDAYSQQAVSYQWFSNQGQIGNTSSILVSTPNEYWVVTKDNIDCSYIDTVKVIADPDPITARFLAASFVNVGDTVVFVQLSYPDPVTYNWDFADGNTSSSSNPIHRYLKPSDFNTTMLVKDPNDCQDQTSKIITVRLLREGGDVEIDLPFFESHYSLYPNPTQDIINVMLDFNQKASTELLLFTQEGKLISSKVINIETGIVEFDIKSLSPGVYVLKVIVNGEVENMRFIKL